MPQSVIAYLATAAVFFVVDLVWLGVIAKGFYARQFGGLLRDNPNMAVSGLFYLGYVAGIVYFAVRPALADGQVGTAAFNGALLGLIAYGTYDITNLATLRGWPWAMSLVDMAWGTALTAAAAAAGFALTRWLA